MANFLVSVTTKSRGLLGFSPYLLVLPLVIACSAKSESDHIQIPVPGIERAILASTETIETNAGGRASQLVANISIGLGRTTNELADEVVPCHFQVSIWGNDRLTQNVKIDQLRFAGYDSKQGIAEFRSNEFFQVYSKTSKIVARNVSCRPGYKIPPGHVDILNEIYE